jgi:hypothetical protein
VVTLVDLLVASVIIAAHEASHLALARAYGVPGTISISTRFILLVAQTDVTGAWMLPRRRRFAIYLVGMATEVALAAVLVLVLPTLTPTGLAATFVRATVLSLGLGVLIQFNLWLRTDVYFVLQDLARCRNLYGDARRLLAHWVRLAVGRPGRPDPRAAMPAHERRAVTAYAPMLLTGVALMVAVFVLVTLPVLVRMVGLAVGDLAPDRSTVDHLDGAVSLLVLAFFHGAVVVLSVHKVRSFVRRRYGSRGGGTGHEASRGRSDEAVISRRRRS